MKPGEMVRVHLGKGRGAATAMYRDPDPRTSFVMQPVPDGALVMFLEQLPTESLYTTRTRIIYQDQVGWFFGTVEPLEEGEP